MTDRIPPPTDNDHHDDTVVPIRRNNNGSHAQRLARNPPNDPHAEQALIGACLLQPARIGDAHHVTPTMFYAARHQAAWAAIIDLNHTGQPVDPVTVAHHIGGTHPTPDGYNNWAHALAVWQNADNITTQAAPRYAQIICDTHQLRQLTAAAATISELGYTAQDPADAYAQAAATLEQVAATSNPGGDNARLFTDLEAVMNGDTMGEPPAIGLRDDNTCAMLYAGELNNIIGESESGKSLISQWWAVEQIAAGNHVIFLDYEKDAATVVERMLQMGAKPEQLVSHFHYTRRDDRWTIAELTELRAQVDTLRPTYAVIDGVTNAMTLEGLNPLDNLDVSKFYGGIPRILAKHGAAALAIDHLTKSREDRAPGAIGAQHKRAGITGVSLKLTMKEPAGRGRTGVGRLWIDKDAPGWLRSHAAAGKAIADVEIQSDGDTLTIRLEPSHMIEQAAGPEMGERRTGYMQRVSYTLEAFGAAGASQSAVEKNTTGKGPWIREALQHLVAEGYVRRDVSGSGFRFTTARPFREDAAADPTLTRYEPPEPEEPDDDYEQGEAF